MSSSSIANCNDSEVLKTLISDLESELKGRYLYDVHIGWGGEGYPKSRHKQGRLRDC